MKTITFHCETITPMFLAGADGQTPELRAPSIKGAMRFWWRAMNGHLVTKDKNGQWDYSKLKEREAEIFGGTDEGAGRSAVILNIENRNYETKEFDLKGSISVKVDAIVKGRQRQFDVGILKYLAYGMYDFKDNSKSRKYILGEFDIKINYDKKYEHDLINSLSALNQFGGLGSKARNGFGSIQLTKTGSGFDLKKIDLNTFTNEKGTFTFFNKDTIFKEIAKGNNALDVLEKIGKAYFDAKKAISPNFLIADSGKSIKEEDVHRYPKTYFFSVKRDGESYKGQVLFLPVFISQQLEKEYNNQHKKFKEALIQ